MKKLFSKKYLQICCSALILLLLNACGYSMMGRTESENYSALGRGDKTIAISKVEQSTLIPWISYELRSKLHSEMQMRKYAKWVDIDEADYLMEINLTSFETREFISDEDDETLLSLASANVIVDIYDRNNTLLWSSGSINFAENYEHLDEDKAIREILQELVYIIYDRMQNAF